MTRLIIPWKTALASDPSTLPTSTETASSNNVHEVSKEDNDQSANNVITTEEQIEAFHIIRALLRDTVSVKRIAMRDVQSYCGILLDDNRKPI